MTFDKQSNGRRIEVESKSNRIVITTALDRNWTTLNVEPSCDAVEAGLEYVQAQPQQSRAA